MKIDLRKFQKDLSLKEYLNDRLLKEGATISCRLPSILYKTSKKQQIYDTLILCKFLKIGIQIN